MRVEIAAGRMLCKHSGLTRRKAAAVLGLGAGSAITYQLRKLERAMESDEKTQKLVARIQKRLKPSR